MGTMSVWHWLILLAVVLLMFGGKGKISSIMGDVADGIKSFKKGMAEDKPPTPDAPKAIDAMTPPPAQAPAPTASATQPVTPPKTI
jgi:sec-independent protein translocase protein TatA